MARVLTKGGEALNHLSLYPGWTSLIRTKYKAEFLLHVLQLPQGIWPVGHYYTVIYNHLFSTVYIVYLDLTLPAPASSCIAFNFGSHGNHGILSNWLFFDDVTKAGQFSRARLPSNFHRRLLQQGSVSVLVGQYKANLKNIRRLPENASNWLISWNKHGNEITLHALCSI